MATRGRYWLALWLVFVLGVLSWVIARQNAALALAAELAERRSTRSAAEAERAALVRRIREAGSRGVLIPRAERLGLRLPADSQIIILQRPEPESR